MRLFNKLMALSGFAAVLIGLVVALLASRIGAEALTWVADLSGSLPWAPILF